MQLSHCIRKITPTWHGPCIRLEVIRKGSAPRQGMPDMLTLSNARNAATFWSAALVTSLLFVSAAIGPLPIA